MLTCVFFYMPPQTFTIISLQQGAAVCFLKCKTAHCSMLRIFFFWSGQTWIQLLLILNSKKHKKQRDLPYFQGSEKQENKFKKNKTASVYVCSFKRSDSIISFGFYHGTFVHCNVRAQWHHLWKFSNTQCMDHWFHTVAEEMKLRLSEKASWYLKQMFEQATNCMNFVSTQ